MLNNLQTNTTSALHNAIIEADGKDRPPLLAPALQMNRTNTEIYTPATNGTADATPTRKSRVKETYATISEEIRKMIDVEAEAVHIIITRINNDIYLIVDACPNAKEMWKVIERLKQGENINKQSPAATQSKDKRIAKAPSLLELDHEVVSVKEETLRDKGIQKLMALILTSFKKIYKPTYNNLRTSSNTKNKNVDYTLRSDRLTGYDRQTGQYENQRAVNVAGNKETIGQQVVQHNGIQCFNYKDFRHVAKECKKAKRPRDSSYHKEKMLICEQHKVGIQLSAEQHD
ncbi:hypothetical protein Tco_1137272 [Tanacetum coccineum]